MPHPSVEQPPPVAAPPIAARPAMRVRGAFNRVLTVVFMTALLVPLLGTWAHWDFSGPNDEKRVLAPAPGVPASLDEAAAWPHQFFSFFADHFGFRQALIHGNNAIEYAIGPRHTPKVLAGESDWLYIRQFNPDPSFFYERGLMPMTDADLDRWQSVLEKRQKYMAARGIPYLIVIAPEKQSIYPEHMPASLRRIGPSRLDQLLVRLQERHSPVRVLDLRQIVLWAKATPEFGTGDLYLRTDTHWNEKGAYFGYQAVMTALAEIVPEAARGDLVTRPLSEFTPVVRWRRLGDLAVLLDQPADTAETWRGLNPVHATNAMIVRGDNDLFETTKRDPALPRLLFFHDSFGNTLVRYFAPHFRAIYAPRERRLLPALIDQQKPDIVINEFVERELTWTAPEDPAEVGATGASARR